ncbi:MAG TPA: O-antigen ligase family protein [Hyphomicrobiaceae bacterium]|nr:O-antigen ligase family protein [Hyphomicrobiaceae bacterium]
MRNDGAELEAGAPLASWERLLGPAVAVATAAALMAPRATPGLLLIVAGAILIAARQAAPDKVSLRPPTGYVIAVGGVLGLYLLVNASWSPARGEAYGKVLFYWVAFAAVSVAAAAATSAWSGRGVGDERYRRLAMGLVAGLAVGSLFLAIESAFAQPIKRAIYSVLAFARPDPKHVKVAADGAVSEIGHYVLNRGIAVMCLLLWPLLAIIARLWPGGALRIALPAGLVALAALAVARSEHETSMLALLAACVTYVGMRVSAKTMQWLVHGGWLLATVLMVPAALHAHKAGLHSASWIPQTGRNRIVLWNVTAQEAMKRPVFGVGVAATKELDEARIPVAKVEAGNTYPERTGRHAHNIYLQAWYELGGVGALLLLAVGAAMLAAMARMPSATQPFAFAGFVSAAVIGGFSWGIWQVWFMAAFALAALLQVFAASAWPLSDAKSSHDDE